MSMRPGRVLFNLRDPDVVQMLVRSVVVARRKHTGAGPGPCFISYAQLSAAIELLAAPADEPVDPFRLAIRIARAPSL